MARSGLKNKDINLLDVCIVKKDTSKYASLMKYLALPVGMTIIVLALFIYFMIANSSLDSNIADKKAELEVVKKQLTDDPLASKYNAFVKLNNDVEKYKRLYQNIQSYPELSQTTFDKILIASGTDIDVTTFSYTRDSQVITLQVTGSDAQSTERFVRRLKNLNIFTAVDYSGYAQQEKQIKSQDDTTDTAKDQTTADSTSDALSDLLNKLNEKTTSTKTNTEAYSVYVATVLCTLK